MARFAAWLMPTDEGYCLSFPDLPGCLAIGSTVEGAVTQAEDALALHLEGMAADGKPLPTPALTPGPMPAVPGALLTLITARPPKAPSVRVNITLDKNLLADIDSHAAHAGFTRSGYLAEAARRMMKG